jgi:FtsP/CotA-like multicopper oxidase with cupredoxin domain
MHTNHFQVVHSSGQGPGAVWEPAEWRDTVYVPAKGNITIRFRPAHFAGASLLHCHTLTHADQGMMAAFDLV